MNWTEALVEELKSRHADGETCREICDALGTSRNAVIGKLHRLGLKPVRPHPQIGNRARHRRRRPKSAKMIAMPKPILPATVATDLPLDQFENPKSLIDLGADECHWPGRGSPATEFCAEPVVPGRPYCARHTHAAYHRLVPVKVRM